MEEREGAWERRVDEEEGEIGGGAGAALPVVELPEGVAGGRGGANNLD